jgi:hypothetical protein
MKKTTLIFGLLLLHTCLMAQDESEFTTHPNGLIYSEPTMSKLSRIVDSLNLKFKVCDANPKYQAAAKTKIQVIRYSSTEDSLRQAAADLKQQMSLDDFKQKYKTAQIMDTLAVSYRQTAQRTIEFFTFPSNYFLWNEVYELDSLPLFEEKQIGVWFVEQKKEYKMGSIQAVRLLEVPQNQWIAPEYARMIQYGDCVIDTTATLFLPSASTRWYHIEISAADSMAVNNFTHLFKDAPESPMIYKYSSQYAKRMNLKSGELEDSIFHQSAEYQQYIMEKEKFKIQQAQFLRKVKETPNFESLKRKALNVVVSTGYSTQFLIGLMQQCGDKHAILLLQRSHRRVGMCSQDESPRLQLQGIAVLAAETAHWESFLRAHLDVMNDRVERVTDGSYAWGGRKTYIRELEELGLDIPKLLIGTCLSFDKPAKNHYFGNISRIGRALAETRYATQVEDLLFKMVQDSQLDDCNRYICFYLFKNYVYNIDDKAKQIICNAKLETARLSLPAYIAEKVNEKD